MFKNLIITGWGLQEYGVAAALTLRCAFNLEADLQALSKMKLAKGLEEDIGKGYTAIYILGVGLDENSAEVAKNVTTLRAQGTEVHWVSRLPIEKGYETFYRLPNGKSVFTSETIRRCYLLEAVQAFFGKRKIPDAERDYYQAILESAKRKGEQRRSYLDYLIAADWKHKNFDDLEPYPEVIRHLARKISLDSLPAKLGKICDDYAKWGRRDLTGESAHIKAVRTLIKKVAKYDNPAARILITGPSGTGKETVAQNIHMLSSRSGQKFLSFNCACTTKELFEDKLFGHVKGAYTNANSDTDGLFKAAEGGTLFLDEVAELDKSLQAYLLRVLQDGDYQKLGSSVVEKVKDVRVISATNRNLEELVRKGEFREDLYYRLNVVQIQMEPLSQRKEDIPLIARSIWRREHQNDPQSQLTTEQKEALKDYDYPGNARELENILLRAMALGETDFKRLLRDYKAQIGHGAAVSTRPEPEVENVKELAHRHILRVQAKYAKTLSERQIAAKLGVSLNTLKKHLQPEK